MSIEYAIIVKNKTRLEALVERFNTQAQAKFYIERLGGNFDDYVQEHERFHAALHTLQVQLSRIIKHKIVERMYVPSFIFSENQVIVVIGQDGLVANTAKYANGLPIVAVNPDKQRYDGVLLPFDIETCSRGVESVMAGNFSSQQMQLAEARLNDGQRLLAFNDLFIGAATHVSARYRINFAQAQEEHSSSGIIVSTRAGFTGWMSSVFNMAYGIAGNKSSKKAGNQRPAPPDQNQLMFAVREPYASVRTQAGITHGLIGPRQPLVIESLMPTNGVIFSDGIESDFLQFNSGAVATIGIAKEMANLVTSGKK